MKILITILISLLLLTSCGRKGALEHLPDEKRPKFDNVIFED